MVRIPISRPPTHPGEMLREEFLLPLNISQRGLADAIHVPMSEQMRLSIRNWDYSKHGTALGEVFRNVGRFLVESAGAVGSLPGSIDRGGSVGVDRRFSPFCREWANEYRYLWRCMIPHRACSPWLVRQQEGFGK